MDNLELYNKVRTVPKDAQKDFKSQNGFKGTDINPMWRIKTLTENFGPAGFGWYIEEVERWTEELDTDVAVYCKIHLFVKDPASGEWSKPIVGIGGSRSITQFSNSRVISDEGYKMAYTDAISVACKALGFGADIYWQNDKTKYTQQQGQQQQTAASRYQAVTLRPEDAEWFGWVRASAANGSTYEGVEQEANRNGRTVPRDIWQKALETL